MTCTLTRERATPCAAVLRDFGATLAQDERIEWRGKILGALSKHKQICNHPAQFVGDNSALAGRSEKLARLEEMLEDASTYRRRANVRPCAGWQRGGSHQTAGYPSGVRG